MFDLTDEHLSEVRRILSEHMPDCEARVFGSRVRGRARKYSDLDIALVGDAKIDERRIESLKDAFADSDLPFRVDVLDWHAISDSFRKVIEKGYEVVQK